MAKYVKVTALLDSPLDCIVVARSSLLQLPRYIEQLARSDDGRHALIKETVAHHVIFAGTTNFETNFLERFSCLLISNGYVASKLPAWQFFLSQFPNIQKKNTEVKRNEMVREQEPKALGGPQCKFPFYVSAYWPLETIYSAPFQTSTKKCETRSLKEVLWLCTQPTDAWEATLTLHTTWTK